MAAIKREKSKALAALTAAALGLPGIETEAAIPVTQAQGDIQYGYYQESGDRMKVEVYHGDFTLPVTDRLEFAFSVDRDTYSGATPSFSMPQTLTNQVRYTESGPARVDVVSAASGGVSAQTLTTLGGLNTFKSVSDGMNSASQKIQGEMQAAIQQANAGANAQMQRELDAYLAEHPNPGVPPTIPGPVALTFPSMSAAYYGKANQNTGTSCPEGFCYVENGFVIGTTLDPSDPNAHLHRTGSPSDRAIQYHADSGGIYFRAANGEAFSLLKMDFQAPTSTGNPGTGPKDLWEILGFNQAVNANLHAGNGTDYASRVAYQTVANGFAGVLALNSLFENVNSVWIHYFGHPKVPTGEVDFSLAVDDINFDKAKFSGLTPAQEAWLADYNSFNQSLQSKYSSQYQSLNDPQHQEQLREMQKQAVIGIYRGFLNGLVPPKAKPVQVYQKQPLETRTMPVFSARYYFDNATLGLSGGQSNEPDFQSTFGTVNFSQELNNKLTTLSAGYSYTGNQITRSGAGHGSHHALDADHNPAIYPGLNENSNFNSFNLGLSQVLSKNSMLQFSANYTRQQGYLANPYKLVYIRGEITAEEYYQLSQATHAGDINWNDITKLEVVGLELFREVRPDLHNQFSFSTHFNQFLTPINAALHLDYRYYIDDWGIDSHTMQLQWIQALPWGFSVSPSMRYYSQSQADFFAPYFLAPRPDGYYSSDFRLSGYGALSGGLTLSKQFNRGIRLDLGMEYYTHQGGLKLGGGGESEYADFSYWMTYARLKLDLSAPGQMFGENAGDEHRHHHHGAPTPAGLMYAHMLDKAGDMMVGYRYMYSNQTGDMRQGSSAASYEGVRNMACGIAKCSERPTDMSMHMHMLELMYAPTDWLNLMLMPQLVDMKMNLKPLAGTEESEHGGGHETHGLGDTLFAALIKVFDAPGHHMHAGIGMSAPTGDVDATIDGSNDPNAYPDSQLQDYGMQLGSGTWDFKPSLIYTGQTGDWSWGAQLSGIKRLDRPNKNGYALGDQIQTTAWGSYRFSQWFSASLRGAYTQQGKIKGEFNRAHLESAPVDFPANYGGNFWDLGFGLNLSVPTGAFAGHQLSVEWLQPLADNYNGYQLEREGSLYATWTYAF